MVSDYHNCTEIHVLLQSESSFVHGYEEPVHLLKNGWDLYTRITNILTMLVGFEIR